MSRKTWLSAAVLALIASGATAPQILEQHIKEREGRELRAYLDSAGIWTICEGKTEGVVAGQVVTAAYCDEWLYSEMGRRFDAVARMVRVPMSQPQHAGVVDHCFNVGITACKTSTLVRELNKGNKQAACDSILRWKYITRAGVKFDCSTAGNLVCWGLWERRNADRELCLM